MPDATAPDVPVPVPDPYVLDVQDLRSGYGRSQVLFGVSLRVPRRGALAILGRNGAGKTTLLRTIMGELPALEGRVFLDGLEVTRTPTERRVRAGVGYVPQEQAVFARLSVRENLEVGAVSAGRGRRDLDRALAVQAGAGSSFRFFRPAASERRLNAPAMAALEQVGLTDRADTAAGEMSHGEKRQLELAIALATQPRLLLLDEPTEGVWIGVIEEIADRLAALSAEIGIVLVEQHLALALRVAGRACVMDRGTVALEGASDAVRDDPRLLRYLAP